MLYSVNKLPTPDACDALLASLAKSRAGLVNRQSNLQFQLTNFAGASSIDAEIATLLSQITTQQNLLVGLPDNDDRRSKENDLLRMQLRRNTLLSRADTYGVIALIEKEHDLALVTVQLTENDALTTAVQARKAAL